jgi:Flp pilus assembly pilin Flp
VKPVFEKVARRLKSFNNDESGGVLEYVLIIGVIALPLVMFLSIFGQNVIGWVQDNAPNIFDEASTWIGG